MQIDKDKMRTTTERGLELGIFDGKRGKNLALDRATLYEYEGCFLHGYREGQRLSEAESRMAS